MLPQISACSGSLDETKCMSFLIKHDELLYKKIWNKVNSSIKLVNS